MKLINQQVKRIMEDCKTVARDADLKFDDGTLEYIVTNKDLVHLTPKIMIPTLYDFWVHDVEILKGEGVYRAYPSNPYETVINTRPAISFYNDNNPDWLNVMIFYHVLGHIDFFQNNIFFKHTWNDDFCGQALADKRLIAGLREDMGEEKRWVDYVIEFSRQLDNLVGFYSELNDTEQIYEQSSGRVNYYFDVFLKKYAQAKAGEYLKEIERYNELAENLGEATGENAFFGEVNKRHPDFAKRLEKSKVEKKGKTGDVMQYLVGNSDFLNKPENRWMKQVMQVARSTSLFFQPQIRTKIINEGWASYWHQELFYRDDRIGGHEVDYAIVNAGVMSMPRVGLNPYALGYRLLEFIRGLAEAGKLSYEFQKVRNAQARKDFNKKTGRGMEFLFKVRENFNDFMLIDFLTDDNFQDFIERYNLFVAGRRLNPEKRVWEYYVKSRSGKDYRQMVMDSLYHPPRVKVNEAKAKDGELYLDHIFEGRMLVTRFIPAVLRGLVYLWGGPVRLETTEFKVDEQEMWYAQMDPSYKPQHKTERVIYTLEGLKQKIRKEVIT